jgi:hypothetical protein
LDWVEFAGFANDAGEISKSQENSEFGEVGGVFCHDKALLCCNFCRRICVVAPPSNGENVLVSKTAKWTNFGAAHLASTNTTFSNPGAGCAVTSVSTLSSTKKQLQRSGGNATERVRRFIVRGNLR